jgi:hypothetical protein
MNSPRRMTPAAGADVPRTTLPAPVLPPVLPLDVVSMKWRHWFVEDARGRITVCAKPAAMATTIRCHPIAPISAGVCDGRGGFNGRRTSG